MKNKILYLILALLFIQCESVNSQIYRKSIRSNKSVVSKKTYFGLKAGVGMMNVNYSGDENLSSLQTNGKNSYILGAFIERSLPNASYGFEVLTSGFGTQIEFQNMSSHTVNYDMEGRYLNVRVPIAIKFLSGNFKPYVFIAPSFAYNYSGSLTSKDVNNVTNQTVVDTTINMGISNMNPYQISATAGVGLNYILFTSSSHILLKLQAGYNQGLTNTYSEKEIQDNSQSVNTNAYNITGSRKNSGLEITFSIAIPIQKSIEGACRNWGEY